MLKNSKWNLRMLVGKQVTESKFWIEESSSFVLQRILEISCWCLCWQTNSSKLEWVSGWWIRHVNPPIDSQVLLFHGMSENSVILHQEITLSEADTESVVGSAGTYFAISILHVPLKRKWLWRWARRILVEFRNSLLLEIMAKLMKLRGGRQTSRVRISIFFVVLPRWRLPGLSPRVSISQRLSEEKGLEGQILSEVVIDIARPPQCEF